MWKTWRFGGTLEAYCKNLETRKQEQLRLKQKEWEWAEELKHLKQLRLK